MARDHELRLLSRYFFGSDIFWNQLSKALSHSSYYAEKNPISKEIRGNGRLVFNGMFGFKGACALYLTRYLPGSGTQLQHYLGNMFSLRRLEEKFDAWKLENLIRFGADFDWIKHKHIFVYAVLGLLHDVMAEKEEEYNSTIYLKWIKDTDHLHPLDLSNRDFKAQAQLLSKQILGKTTTLEVVKTNDKGYFAVFNLPVKGDFKTKSTSSPLLALKEGYILLLKQLASLGEENLMLNLSYIAKKEEEKTQKQANKLIQKQVKADALAKKRLLASQRIAEKKSLAKALNKSKEQNKLRAKNSQQEKHLRMEKLKQEEAKKRQKRDGRKVRRSDK